MNLLTKERFWSKVSIGEDNECWEWMAGANQQGYGRFRLGNKDQYAHRVSWLLTYGEIPESMCVCHHCDNPSCVNPSHLFLGTRADNMADSAAKERRRGEQNPNAKLTEDDVLEIRRLWAETDLYQREIAEMFGVTQWAIKDILHRKSWAWL